MVFEPCKFVFFEDETRQELPIPGSILEVNQVITGPISEVWHCWKVFNLTLDQFQFCRLQWVFWLWPSRVVAHYVLDVKRNEFYRPFHIVVFEMNLLPCSFFLICFRGHLRVIFSDIMRTKCNVLLLTPFLLEVDFAVKRTRDLGLKPLYLSEVVHQVGFSLKIRKRLGDVHFIPPLYRGCHLAHHRRFSFFDPQWFVHWWMIVMRRFHLWFHPIVE